MERERKIKKRGENGGKGDKEEKGAELGAETDRVESQRSGKEQESVAGLR